MKSGQMGFNFEVPPRSVQSPVAETQASTVLTVSQLSRKIRGHLEGEFQQIWVRGEISNFKAHTSGHHYFSLKDKDSQISAVMFKGFNSKLKFLPGNGMEVVLKGKITVYEMRGNYQVVCDWMEPVGAGALQMAFEQLKVKLEKEGLFDLTKKRRLPLFPKHIGIVTSPTGAAIKDILNVLRRRYRGARVTLAPTLVQGVGAAEQIAKALELLNQLSDIDVIIVGRGGGSMEDLWPFNEEIVARAIACSQIPTISAVGHEVDFTISDFVADLRAPTPSAAAELVVKNASELAERTVKDAHRLKQAMRTQLTRIGENIKYLSKRLVDPRRRLQDLILRCDDLSDRLVGSIERYIGDRRTSVEMAVHRLGTPASRLEGLRQQVRLRTQAMISQTILFVKASGGRLREGMAKLETLSPLKVVERGYSIVTAEETGAIVKDARLLRPADTLSIRFASGEARAKVIETKT